MRCFVTALIIATSIGHIATSAHAADVSDLDLTEDFNVGDLGIDTDSYDLGGFDDFGGFGF